MHEVYNIINKELDEYDSKGISGKSLVDYLNANKSNFDGFVKKVADQVKQEPTAIEEMCKDAIRDRLAYIKDTL